MYDVIVSGAGMVGMVLAFALRSQSLSVLILEKNTESNFAESIKKDNRTSAISHESANILRKFELWQLLECYAEPILDIFVRGGRKPCFLHYNSELVDSVPMGYTIPNEKIREILSSLSLDIKFSSTCIGCTEANNSIFVHLRDDVTLQAKLLVIAEGKDSNLREELKIKSHNFSYSQSCIITNVIHKEPHNNVAWELFYRSGPLAVLPLRDPHQSALIWTDSIDKATEIMQLDKPEFIKKLNKKCTLEVVDYLGIKNCYPLSLSFITEYYKGKAVFMGDTLHAIHPVAGQGFNLALYDIDAFINAMCFGFASEIMLNNFYRKRIKANLAMIFMTDSIVRVFSNRRRGMHSIASLGLAAINESSRLKTFLMKCAMGI